MLTTIISHQSTNHAIVQLFLCIERECSDVGKLLQKLSVNKMFLTYMTKMQLNYVKLVSTVHKISVKQNYIMTLGIPPINDAV